MSGGLTFNVAAFGLISNKLLIVKKKILNNGFFNFENRWSKDECI